MPVENKLEPMYIMKRASNDYNWKVVELLGAGGYGCVYKVIQVKNDGSKLSNTEYAMKTESKNATRSASRLKIEKSVMIEYSKREPHLREHFPEIIDYGQSTTQKFIVMTLVGPSLDSLKKKGFSLPTALRCGLQTGKAIFDLHAVGFLHRDIKPGNFCAGLGANTEVVYILDFGLARIFRRKDGTHRPMRTRGKMTGTPRYCSRSAHRKQDLGRKDDFESWYYMLLDLIDHEKGIQWKGKPREEAFTMKLRMFQQPTWICTQTLAIPISFGTMAQYLNDLEYASDVEWGVFREVITDYARDMKITLHEPMDWVTVDKNIKAPHSPVNGKSRQKKQEKADTSKGQTATSAAFSSVSAVQDENSLDTQVGDDSSSRKPSISNRKSVSTSATIKKKV